ncbi:MAG: ABC transporter substrate-binding protein [Chitinophagaceae bacterium]
MNKLLFTDQLNRTIHLDNYPKRIVSIVPSQTELLFDLGLYEEVVGITKFCVHPNEWFKTKVRVGGTKKIDIAKIAALQPDLIIANKEENLKEDVEALEQIAPVWISDIKTLVDALQMIENVGEIVNKKLTAKNISQIISIAFKKLKTNQKKSCCYLIWQNPYMTVGNDTFINDMFQYCGLQNVFSNKERYPIITLDVVKDVAPEMVLLSSEPYPFKQKHIDELQKHLPNSKVILVDGEMFSWYGSRLLKTANYFKELISF